MKLLFILFVFGIATAVQVGISDDITVGGLSSGAFMAVQTHVALSETVKGAAVFAGGPYFCAMADFATANTNCMALGTNIDIDHLISVIKDNEAKGLVDSSENLAGSNVYVFSGTKDYTVNPKVNQNTQAFYEKLGANVESLFDFDAAHTMPTEDFGAICTVSMPPYIGKCGLNGAQVSLQHLHQDKVSNKLGETSAPNVFSIPQSTDGTVMGGEAFAYIPTACQSDDADCSLHVVFHGCLQTIKDIQMQYVESTGYNEVAEANDMVILYPQAVSKSSGNPYGCWDWWGFINNDYATNQGKQIAEVKRLIDLLKSGDLKEAKQVYPRETLKE
ncbi:unnamed protein product [Moneuplotes crassus]|uniref:Polyhydroxybutyrate depolymerase n=1 Tax=Euplotes crassus TaxID=5936 RepID=A0AAD1XC88_EUPCR|nr:unnamed protein product [Moneuplotes crassus]